MTDMLITLLIVGGCATFLGIRALRSFQGKGTGCGGGCSGGCRPSWDAPCNQPDIQAHIKQMSQHK